MYPIGIEELHPSRDYTDKIFRPRSPSIESEAPTYTRNDRQPSERPARELEIDGATPARTERLPRLRRDDDTLEDVQRKYGIHRYPNRRPVSWERHMVDV